MSKIVGRIIIEPAELPGRNVQFASEAQSSTATFYIYWSVSGNLKPGTGFASVDVDVDQTHAEMLDDLRAGLALAVNAVLNESPRELHLNSAPLNEPNQFNVFFAPADVVGCEF